MWCFFFSSRRRHTRCGRDWSSDVCSSDLRGAPRPLPAGGRRGPEAAREEGHRLARGPRRPSTAERHARERLISGAAGREVRLEQHELARAPWRALHLRGPGDRAPEPGGAAPVARPAEREVRRERAILWRKPERPEAAPEVGDERG